jgi:hypothetical protein
MYAQIAAKLPPDLRPFSVCNENLITEEQIIPKRRKSIFSWFLKRAHKPQPVDQNNNFDVRKKMTLNELARISDRPQV